MPQGFLIYTTFGFASWPKGKILTQLGAFNFVGVKAGQSTVPANLQITNYSLSEVDTANRSFTLSNNHYEASDTTDSVGYEFQNRQFLRGSTQEFKKLI